MQETLEDPENPDYHLPTAVIHRIASLESLTDRGGYCYDFPTLLIGGLRTSIIVAVSHVTHRQTTDFYFDTSLFSHDSYMSHYVTFLTRLIHESLCYLSYTTHT